MDRKKVDGIWLLVSVVSFLLMSLSFLLMPLGTTPDGGQAGWIPLVSGICFWAFLLIGVFSQILLSKRRRDWYSRYHVRHSRNKHARLGVAAFCQNRPAIIADTAMVVSVIGLVVSMLLTGGAGYSCFIFLALLAFSLSMHCILNGRLYDYVINQERFLRELEKERAQDKQKGE